jgi:hypothetical protein
LVGAIDGLDFRSGVAPGRGVQFEFDERRCRRRLDGSVLERKRRRVVEWWRDEYQRRYVEQRRRDVEWRRYRYGWGD